jgi:alkylation response protein AidB-like acyl-CoA dehydrogenase
MTITAPPIKADRPTDEELTARVHSLGEIIRAHGPQGESDRRIPEATIQALTQQGLFRLGTPRRYGGSETSVKTMLDVSSTIAEYDGATAWVSTLINVTTWAAALFGSAARDEVFGKDPDAKVSGVGSSPHAEIKQAEGGLRVSGRWYYNSGGLHSDWVLLGMVRTDDSGNMVGHNSLLIPRSEVGIEETWFVAGMRGTGSNCVVADNVFVPEHRVANTLDFVEGHFINEHADEEPFYRSAWQPVLALVLVGPQLGMAREAFRLVASQAGKRAISMTFYEKERDSVGFQLQIARAKMMIESAHLHAYRAAADIDRAAAANEYPDNLLRSRIRADCGWAVEHVRDAIQLLIDANGAGSFAESNPLQRIWRDCNVGGHHALMNYTVNYEIYGKQLLGVETPVVPTI